MKILHLAVSCFYIDGYNFQENIIPRFNLNDGHEVKIIASTETYVTNNKLGYVTPSKYINNDGIIVERIPYRKFLPRKIMSKLRMYIGLYNKISEFKPDVILHHGVPSFELFTLSKYKSHNPRVKIYLDSHEDKYNSAKNFLSKVFLHKIYYKLIVRKNYKNFEKILCVSLESMDFCSQVYKIPTSYLEFFPLGGEILANDEYENNRKKNIKKYDLEDKIIFIHSGKMNERKKTLMLLEQFTKLENKNLILLLAGSFSDEIKVKSELYLKEDSRIKYLGWLNSNEINGLMCASDVYVQPGSQSASLQNAICYRNAIIAYEHKSHVPFVDGNGYLIRDEETLYNAMKNISQDVDMLISMKAKSFDIAIKLLDYKELSKRIYV